MKKGDEPPDSPPPPYPGRESPDTYIPDTPDTYTSDTYTPDTATHDSDTDQKYNPKLQPTYNPKLQPKHNPKLQPGPIIHGHKPPTNNDKYYPKPQHYQHYQHGHQHPTYQHQHQPYPQHPPPAQPYPHHPHHPSPQPNHHPPYLSSSDAALLTGDHSGRVIIGQQPRSVSGRDRSRCEVMTSDDHSPPNSYLALSMVTCLCFSPLLGLIAICFSAFSTSAYERGDRATSRMYGRTALAFSIAGIVISLIILVIVLIGGFI